MVRILKIFRNFPGGEDLTKKLMWTFDVDYVTRNSYVQLLATLCVFSTIVPSYVTHINRPQKFWGMMLYPSLPLALGYQHLGYEVVSIITIDIALPTFESVLQGVL